MCPPIEISDQEKEQEVYRLRENFEELATYVQELCGQVLTQCARPRTDIINILQDAHNIVREIKQIHKTIALCLTTARSISNIGTRTALVEEIGECIVAQSFVPHLAISIYRAIVRLDPNKAYCGDKSLKDTVPIRHAYFMRKAERLLKRVGVTELPLV